MRLKRRGCGVGVVATALVVLAVLSPGGSLAPVAVQAADPAARVWNVDPGDAGQIQATINAARDAGGGAVYLPAAVYLLTAKIRVHSNVTVYGDGIEQTILRW